MSSIDKFLLARKTQEAIVTENRHHVLLNNLDNASVSADIVVDEFLRTLKKSGLQFFEVTVFLVSGQAPGQVKSQMSRCRATRKQSRDFTRIIEDYSFLRESDDHTRLKAEDFIVTRFGESRLFSLKKAMSVLDIWQFCIDCFNERCVTVNFWLGDQKVWLLAGQR